ncbi:MAG: hypothetical protein JXA82_06320 [Sedimentisphaerales bacterium]|nr:hypothetical protein [Sedimentisphaerales bacterium]
MAQKIRNPLAQALGLVLQGMRDKMGGISSSEIASSLGLAASHYRMIEAGSAILQPSRAIKVVQTFDTIEFVPLCQVLVCIQILDSVRTSGTDMRVMADVLQEANPSIARVLGRFSNIWTIVDHASTAELSRQLAADEIDKELTEFLTTEPVTLSADQIGQFMSPTYQHPISGQLYSKIGDILQGVAPFYLDTVLQLIDNLRDITPRVTPHELARWEAAHKNRINYIVGIVRKPEIILDVEAFDYSFLWQENFHKMFIMHRDPPAAVRASVKEEIVSCLRQKYEAERVKYERILAVFDDTIGDKLTVRWGQDVQKEIDELLAHRDTEMNNLWFYFMASGYVVPFIDNASVDGKTGAIYGTSLDYDQTCSKLVRLREVCGDIGFAF